MFNHPINHNNMAIPRRHTGIVIANSACVENSFELMVLQMRIYGLQYNLGRLAQRLERLLHTQEVTGSNPVPPTTSSVPSQGLSLRELLEVRLGPEGRKRLQLRHKAN